MGFWVRLSQPPLDATEGALWVRFIGAFEEIVAKPIGPDTDCTPVWDVAYEAKGAGVPFVSAVRAIRAAWRPREWVKEPSGNFSECLVTAIVGLAYMVEGSRAMVSRGTTATTT